VAKLKPDDYEPDADENDCDEPEVDGHYIVSWGVEVVTSKPREKSHMFSARKIVLGSDSVFVELADGQTITYTTGQIKKILAMKSTLPVDDSTEKT
jgi:hypothetical protein